MAPSEKKLLARYLKTLQSPIESLTLLSLGQLVFSFVVMSIDLSIDSCYHNYQDKAIFYFEGRGGCRWRELWVEGIVGRGSTIEGCGSRRSMSRS